MVDLHLLGDTWSCRAYVCTPVLRTLAHQEPRITFKQSTVCVCFYFRGALWTRVEGCRALFVVSSENHEEGLHSAYTGLSPEEICGILRPRVVPQGLR